MTTSPSHSLRNLLIALAAVLVGIGLFWGNHTRTQSVSLPHLAEHSIPLELARQNSKPTLIEFYADWCTSCRSMAPLMAEMETMYADQINFVMLNVDNPKWLPELNQFHVNGIPHFVFVDSQGSPVGNAIGEQPASVLQSNLLALLEGETVAAPSTLGRTSAWSAPVTIPSQPRQPDPRSHA